jgi:chromosome segregation ATPase
MNIFKLKFNFIIFVLIKREDQSEILKEKENVIVSLETTNKELKKKAEELETKMASSNGLEDIERSYNNMKSEKEKMEFEFGKVKAELSNMENQINKLELIKLDREAYYTAKINEINSQIEKVQNEKKLSDEISRQVSYSFYNFKLK